MLSGNSHLLWFNKKNKRTMHPKKRTKFPKVSSRLFPHKTKMMDNNKVEMSLRIKCIKQCWLILLSHLPLNIIGLRSIHLQVILITIESVMRSPQIKISANNKILGKISSKSTRKRKSHSQNLMKRKRTINRENCNNMLPPLRSRNQTFFNQLSIRIWMNSKRLNTSWASKMSKTHQCNL